MDEHQLKALIDEFIIDIAVFELQHDCFVAIRWITGDKRTSAEEVYGPFRSAEDALLECERLREEHSRATIPNDPIYQVVPVYPAGS